MATEQQLLDALEQSIANTDRGNSDLLLVMKEGNLNDVTLRDNTVVPSLSKRVKENTDVFKGEFEASVNLQTQAQLDLFNTNATTALNGFDTTSTTSLQNLQTAIDSINNEGNAASATKLQNPRLINNVPFDGTQDINTPTATTTTAGIVQLVNDLTTGGTGNALTAEMGKWLLGQFDTGAGAEFLYFKLPNKNSLTQPIIVILGTMAGEIVAGNSNTVYFPFEFPNGVPRVFVCNGDGIASRNNVISVGQDIRRNAFGWIGNSSGASRANYIAIGV